DALEERVERLQHTDRFAGVAQAALAWAPAAVALSPVHPALAGTPFWLGADVAREEFLRVEEERLARRHALAALRHYLQARDACPLMGKPNVRLAANINRLDRAESASAYLERAKFLVPAD